MQHFFMSKWQQINKKYNLFLQRNSKMNMFKIPSYIVGIIIKSTENITVERKSLVCSDPLL